MSFGYVSSFQNNNIFFQNKYTVKKNVASPCAIYFLWLHSFETMTQTDRFQFSSECSWFRAKCAVTFACVRKNKPTKIGEISFRHTRSTNPYGKTSYPSSSRNDSLPSFLEDGQHLVHFSVTRFQRRLHFLFTSLVHRPNLL